MPNLSRVVVKGEQPTVKQAGFLSVRRVEPTTYWNDLFADAEVYRGCQVKQVGRLWWTRGEWSVGTSISRADAIRAIDVMKG